MYLEERTREDYSSYVEKPQHLQGGWPVRHRGLNQCKDSFFLKAVKQFLT